jgi:hypothetical protein
VRSGQRVQKQGNAYNNTQEVVLVSRRQREGGEWSSRKAGGGVLRESMAGQDHTIDRLGRRQQI